MNLVIRIRHVFFAVLSIAYGYGLMFVEEQRSNELLSEVVREDFQTGFLIMIVIPSALILAAVGFLLAEYWDHPVLNFNSNSNKE